MDCIECFNYCNSTTFISEPPEFILGKCFVKNNSAHLTWQSRKDRPQKCVLQRRNNSGAYDVVYEGKSSTDVQVDVEYNEVALFNVYAVNAAGQGFPNEDMKLKAPKGMDILDYPRWM